MPNPAPANSICKAFIPYPHLLNQESIYFLTPVTPENVQKRHFEKFKNGFSLKR